MICNHPPAPEPCRFKTNGPLPPSLRLQTSSHQRVPGNTNRPTKPAAVTQSRARWLHSIRHSPRRTRTRARRAPAPEARSLVTAAALTGIARPVNEEARATARSPDSATTPLGRAASSLNAAPTGPTPLHHTPTRATPTTAATNTVLTPNKPLAQTPAQRQPAAQKSPIALLVRAQCAPIRRKNGLWKERRQTRARTRNPCVKPLFCTFRHIAPNGFLGFPSQGSRVRVPSSASLTSRGVFGGRVCREAEHRDACGDGDPSIVAAASNGAVAAIRNGPTHSRSYSTEMSRSALQRRKLV